MLKVLKNYRFFLILLMLYSIYAIGFAGNELTQTPPDSSLAWWIWALILFGFTFVLGLLAVMAGVGGGVLFVPIVGTFFPPSLIFVKGAGLLVALSGALSAGPELLRKGLADLRLALPFALLASSFAIGGALAGNELIPAYVTRIALGGLILLIVAVMFLAKKADFPNVPKPDSLSAKLGINGSYYDESLKKTVSWQIHRMPLGLVMFV